MKLPLLFARRYLFSRKSQNAINYIAGISVLGFTVASAAMVVILSIMNGMEDMALSAVSHFDPDIKITAVKGKVFDPKKAGLNEIRQMPGVRGVVEALEENGVAQYNGVQDIVKIKGLSPDFIRCSGLDTFVYDGDFELQNGSQDFALVGGGIGYRLNVSVGNPMYTLGLIVPKRNTKSTSPDALSQLNLYPSGLFAVDETVNSEYILVPLRFARELLSYPDQTSSLEVFLHENADEEDVIEDIRELAGPDFKILDRYEQQPLLYRIFRIEKWATFAILAFVMLIAAFNVIGSLTMLVLEKKKDISLLRAMGMPDRRIRRIFLSEGLLISTFGGILGMLIGLAVCYLQMRFGFITFAPGEGDYALAYPVKVMGFDCLLVAGTSLILGMLTSFYPAARSTSQDLPRLA